MFDASDVLRTRTLLSGGAYGGSRVCGCAASECAKCAANFGAGLVDPDGVGAAVAPDAAVGGFGGALIMGAPMSRVEVDLLSALGGSVLAPSLGVRTFPAALFSVDPLEDDGPSRPELPELGEPLRQWPGDVLYGDAAPDRYIYKYGQFCLTEDYVVFTLHCDSPSTQNEQDTYDTRRRIRGSRVVLVQRSSDQYWDLVSILEDWYGYGRGTMRGRKATCVEHDA